MVLIDTVKKFRYCKGIQDSEYVALNEQNFVKEVWSKSGNEYYSYLPWNYFNVSIFRWSLCHFYEINRLLLCFFSDLYFRPQNSGKNIRSASGFFIAGIPFVKNPGLSFLHFRLRWCSLAWKRSCFTILGEISWKRSTYQLKFEHGQLGKCLRNSLIWQCHM